MEAIQNARNIVNKLKVASNPMGMLQQMAQSNENVSNMLNILKQSGGDPQKAVYSLINNSGIDLEMLKKMYNGN